MRAIVAGWSRVPLATLDVYPGHALASVARAFSQLEMTLDEERSGAQTGNDLVSGLARAGLYWS